ncbi:MAG: HD domain-containing protein [Pirellulales bacterium]
MSHLLDQTLAAQMSVASPEQRADLLLDYLVKHGQSNYDENVTQLEHALQTATLARQAGAAQHVVASALLHDLGHLLVGEHAATGNFLAEDLNHEEVAAEYLQPFFGPEVTEPIRLHVPAKRYLCSTDDSYYTGLSDASKKSFAVQGGNMSTDERAELEANSYLQQALQLRRWDDGGKVCGLETPPVKDFRRELLTALQK